MNTQDGFYAHITKLVADNRIGTAFDMLEKELPRLQRENSRHYHSALLLLQEYNQIKQRQIQGLMVASEDQHGVSLRLLQLSQELEKPHPAYSPDPLGAMSPGATQPPPIRREPPPPPVYAPTEKKKGISFGKIIMYVLAGLGALVILGLLIDDEGDEDYYSNQESYYVPPGGATIVDNGDTWYGEYLANSRWISTAVGYEVTFGTQGDQASLRGVNSGTIRITGIDTDDNLIGTFDIAGMGHGDVVIVPPVDGPQITVYSKLSQEANYSAPDIWQRQY